MAESIQVVQSVEAGEYVATFEWRNLHFHIITRESLTADQVKTIGQALPKVKGVGLFADYLGIVFGRQVRVRTERPSPDVRFEVGL